MERDPVLLGSILHEMLKAKYDFSDTPLSLDISDETQDVIDYHVLLLAEAGLIVTKTNEEGRPRPVRLTWKGHDYVEKSVESVADGLSSAVAGLDSAAGEIDELLDVAEEVLTT